MPGDGTGSYKTGHYRDLFAEQGHPAAETNARLERAFQQLFHGDAVSERVYFEAGKKRKRPLGLHDRLGQQRRPAPKACPTA